MATWSALSQYSVTSSQALSEAAPSLVSEGIPLVSISSILPVVTAPNGQTFNGTGALRAYYWSHHHQAWIRFPALDEDMTEANGLSKLAFPPITVSTQANRFALLADNVGVSSGTTITVDLVAI